MPIFSFQSFSMHFLIFAINFAAESRRSSLFPLDVYSNSEFDLSLQTSAKGQIISKANFLVLI